MNPITWWKQKKAKEITELILTHKIKLLEKDIGTLLAIAKILVIESGGEMRICTKDVQAQMDKYDFTMQREENGWVRLKAEPKDMPSTNSQEAQGMR